MDSVAGRVVLWVLAALAVIGGGMLVAMVVVYFGADEYVPELNEFGGWGILAGMCGLGVYVAGAFRGPLLMRIGAGLGLAGVGYAVSMIVAFLVSLTADRGGPRGNLEDGTAGFIWLLAGAYFAWQLASRRWPVAQQEPTTADR
ncbi:hypothetical protein MOQ72_36865 [Saccharopolyspora sp. K220]|uniref:hypothetical protein n=1 Tax=Saccharopolyspora soli TaxID=2926618 RepID=UPI001F58CE1B|nr:hypothetical protein [Saccharopolyspora soli]MCI2423003.1 hypothetical protein [Saccharopolyspora soli]